MYPRKAPTGLDFHCGIGERQLDGLDASRSEWRGLLRWLTHSGSSKRRRAWQTRSHRLQWSIWPSSFVVEIRPRCFRSKQISAANAVRWRNREAQNLTQSEAVLDRKDQFPEPPELALHFEIVSLYVTQFTGSRDFPRRQPSGEDQTGVRTSSPT
jgi:hypothetical protein